jgi:beta-phosphoglucomutase-like phosphatase (HAD superfamily)
MNAKEKTTLQALFFDFDGVIVDSIATKTEAFRTLFGEYDAKIVEEVVAYHQQHGGISRVEKIRYAYQHIIKQPLSDEGLANLAAVYAALVVEKVVSADWIAGAKGFLDSVQGTMPIFVISGTPEKELRYIVERRGMAGYFRDVLGSPIRKPVHIRNLVTDHRFVPEQCVFVGDALTDFYAARETGLTFVGIQGEVTFPVGTTVLPDCRGLRAAIAELFTW